MMAYVIQTTNSWRQRQLRFVMHHTNCTAKPCSGKDNGSPHGVQLAVLCRVHVEVLDVQCNPSPVRKCQR